MVIETICSVISVVCAIISTVFGVLSYIKEKKTKESLQYIQKIKNDIELKINSNIFDISGDMNKNIQIFNNCSFPSKVNIGSPGMINDKLTELHKKEEI